jgi:hypothetical protein
MAILQQTTVTSYDANVTASASTIICTNPTSVQQWAGFVGVQTPYYDTVNNYADILSTNSGFTWVVGFIAMPANQSYNTSHAFWFALSRYGLQFNWLTNDGLLGLSRYQDPGNADISHLRITNLYNASWAYGNYHINATIFTPSNSISSTYLTRMN